MAQLTQQGNVKRTDRQRDRKLRSKLPSQSDSAVAAAARRSDPRLPGALSKSSARRQKRRERDQLAGNTDGMQDLANAVESLEDEIPTDEAAVAPQPAETTTAKNMTAARKRDTLSRERQRQPHILADLERSSNPFAALRQHARVTMGLRGKPGSTEVDEDMR